MIGANVRFRPEADAALTANLTGNHPLFKLPAMSLRIAVIVIAGCLSLNAAGEIEKIASPSEAGFSLHWWPKVRPPKGWHRDEDQSFSYGINALAPDGSTFANAETVMYAKAIYKPREPEIKSLRMLMESDRKQFLSEEPTLSVAPASSLHTADGKQLESVAFTPRAKGNWERVSYGEEGEFFIVFVISSRSQSGYQRAMPAYERLISSYREKH